MSDKAADAAEILVQAFKSKKPIANLPENLKPMTPDEAYAIQEAGMKMMGGVQGWKVGHGPPIYRAPVFSVQSSGAVLKGADLHGAHFEIELAFRLLKDFSPRAADYTEAEIYPQLEFLPLIEVAASRYLTEKADGYLGYLAEFGSSAVLVVGKTVADWQGIDFGPVKGELTVNGKVVQSGTGADNHEGDNPATLVVWLINFMTKRGFSFKAGEIITTGALDGGTDAKTGDKAVADFGKYGKIEVQLV